MNEAVGDTSPRNENVIVSKASAGNHDRIKENILIGNEVGRIKC